MFLTIIYSYDVIILLHTLERERGMLLVTRDDIHTFNMGLAAFSVG